MQIPACSCTQRIRTFTAKHPNAVRKAIITTLALSAIGVVAGLTLILASSLGHLPVAGIGQSILFPAAASLALSFVLYSTRSKNPTAQDASLAEEESSAQKTPPRPTAVPDRLRNPPRLTPRTPTRFLRVLSPLNPERIQTPQIPPTRDQGFVSPAGTLLGETHVASPFTTSPGTPLPAWSRNQSGPPQTSSRVFTPPGGHRTPSISPVKLFHSPERHGPTERSPSPQLQPPTGYTFVNSRELSPERSGPLLLSRVADRPYEEMIKFLTKLESCLANSEHIIIMLDKEEMEQVKDSPFVEVNCMIRRRSTGEIVRTFKKEFPKVPSSSRDVTMRAQVFHKCAEELGIGVDEIGNEFLRHKGIREAREANYIIFKYHDLRKALVIHMENGNVESAYVDGLAMSAMAGLMKYSNRPVHYIVNFSSLHLSP